MRRTDAVKTYVLPCGATWDFVPGGPRTDGPEVTITCQGCGAVHHIDFRTEVVT